MVKGEREGLIIVEGGKKFDIICRKQENRPGSCESIQCRGSTVLVTSMHLVDYVPCTP